MPSSQGGPSSNAGFAVAPDEQIYRIENYDADSAEGLAANDCGDNQSVPFFVDGQPTPEARNAIIEYQNRIENSRRASRREENKRQHQPEMALARAANERRRVEADIEMELDAHRAEMETRQKVLDEKRQRQAHKREMQKLRVARARENKFVAGVAYGAALMVVGLLLSWAVMRLMMYIF